jgi:uncharacterized protein YcbK (DUF882 family)
LSNNLKHSLTFSSPHGRRHFLKMCAGALICSTGLATTPSFAQSRNVAAERSLSFYNLHTSESLRTTYWAEGSYIPESMSDINFLLRDFRDGEIKAIDPNLLDTLHLIMTRLDTSAPIHLISGYRSPSTNAKLHARSSGVAKHSLHMEGMAADIRIPGHDLRDVLKVAMQIQGGGVGYYPRSDFVHVDVGKIRHWIGS